MIAIEFKKILREAAVMILIILLISLVIVWTGKDVYLAPSLEVFLLLFAAFNGWSVFDRERQEGAMEYLLSLPVTPFRKFCIKTVSRFVSTMIMLVIYCLLRMNYDWTFALPSMLVFVLFYLTVYFLALSMSLSLRNFLISFFISVFLPAGLFYLILLLDSSRSFESIALQTILSLIYIPFLFIFVYLRSYDLKPAVRFNKKLIPSVLGLLIVVLAVNYYLTRTRWEIVFPAGMGGTISTSASKTVLLNKEKERFVFKRKMDVLYEDRQFIYLQGMTRGTKGAAQLNRLDMATGRLETIYVCEPGWWFHSWWFERVVVNDRLYFLLTSQNHTQYKILEITEDRQRTIPVNGRFSHDQFCWLSAAYGQPVRFIAFKEPVRAGRQSAVIQIEESGKHRVLFKAAAVAVWSDRLLVFTDNEMVLYDLEDGPREIYRKQGKIRKIRRRFGSYIQRDVLIKLEDGLFVFNMDTLTLIRLDIERLPYFYASTSKGIRMVFIEGDEIAVSSLENGRMVVENTWISNLEGEKIFRVIPSGVLVSLVKKPRHEIFRFMKEEGGK